MVVVVHGGRLQIRRGGRRRASCSLARGREEGGGKLEGSEGKMTLSKGGAAAPLSRRSSRQGLARLWCRGGSSIVLLSTTTTTKTTTKTTTQRLKGSNSKKLHASPQQSIKAARSGQRLDLLFVVRPKGWCGWEVQLLGWAGEKKRKTKRCKTLALFWFFFICKVGRGGV